MVGKVFRQSEDLCKAVFVTDTNPVKRMTIPTLRWALKRLAPRVAVAVNVYPHSFHHNYAYQLLDNGAPLDFIQGMLGHERPHKSMLNYAVNDAENYIGDSFSFVSGRSHFGSVSFPLSGSLVKINRVDCCPLV